MPQCQCAPTTQSSSSSFLMMGGKRKSLRSRRNRKKSTRTQNVRKRSRKTRTGRRRRPVKKQVRFQAGGMLGGPITSSVPFTSSLLGAPYISPDGDSQRADDTSTKNYLT